MRVLVATTLYPNEVSPNHGIFVENRFRAVLAAQDIEVKVVAPAPWFPLDSKIFGSWAKYAKIPSQEQRYGIDIRHPKYLVIPKLGMTAAVHALEHALFKQAQKLIECGWDFDLIDAHYFYPDGVAAARVAEKLGKPIVITARGSDINLIPQYHWQRMMVLEAAQKSTANITVCQALKDEMIRIGAQPDKITVLRNGVNLTQFRPLDRTAIRRKLGVEGLVLLSAGLLIERKGHDLVIAALEKIPHATLLIAGDGPAKNSLIEKAKEHNVLDRTRFLGHVPHEDITKIYNAADVLVLASSREGWPNVLLESMACGTPVVASPVWGAGEIVTAPVAGILSQGRNVEAITSAILKLAEVPPARDDTRAFAEKFSWDDTAKGVLDQFEQAITQGPYRPLTQNWYVEKAVDIQDNTPRLLVTVDTEEIFNWDDTTYSDWSCADPQDIDRFQKICNRHHVKPLYFITWPLMEDPATAEYFKDLHHAGKADLGIHLHQWVTPPKTDINTPYTSYQCNLTPQLHEKKLKNLIAKFQEVFGFAPIAHRAGRYGVASPIHEALINNDIYFDFSPSAQFDLSRDGGPDFSGVTSHSWIREDLGKGPLLCMPVSGKRFYRKTGIFLKQPLSRYGSFHPTTTALKNSTTSVRLTPEGFDVSMMQKTSASLTKDKIFLQSFSLHSTSLTLGATPYSQYRSDIELLLSRTDRFFEWFKKEKKGKIITLNDLTSFL